MDSTIRRIPLQLPTADYKALEALAQREERTPMQQAAYIVRKSLAAATTHDTPSSDAFAAIADAGSGNG